MGARICWCCQDNLSWDAYNGDYLGDNGEKPCYDCVAEKEAADDLQYEVEDPEEDGADDQV